MKIRNVSYVSLDDLLETSSVDEENEIYQVLDEYYDWDGFNTFALVPVQDMLQVFEGTELESFKAELKKIPGGAYIDLEV